MRSRPPLDFVIAKQLFRLDGAGTLFWRESVNGRALAGSMAGCNRPDGYRQIKVRGQSYMAHQIVWLLVHGVWPDHEIDHIDRNPSNNAPTNLRKCTHSQNLANQPTKSRLGIRGVRLQRGRYQAVITVRGKQKSLGTFDCCKEAARAYQAEARRAFGEFASV
jgi:hypothetical protein